MTGSDLKAPFPWFGGKRRVAPQVWDALGDVDMYVEPFAGSLAVLLAKPAGERREIVNDKDSYVTNFWRAVTADPELVAHYADWPVNETDLFARHLWLVNAGQQEMERGLRDDPEWFSAKIAGWWVWGLSSWIGSDWCTGTGPHTYTGDTIGATIWAQRPNTSQPAGVSNRRPRAGRPIGVQSGVKCQIPRLSAAQGVNASAELVGRFRLLADRLRRVVVCNGDWSRVVTAGSLGHARTAGVFLDPPYSGDVRDKRIYRVDDHTVSDEVREWCLTNGPNLSYRIVLAGYRTEHDDLMPDTWRRVAWSAGLSYQNSRSKGANSRNRHLEMLWLSPGCVEPLTLFDRT